MFKSWLGREEVEDVLPKSNSTSSFCPSPLSSPLSVPMNEFCSKLYLEIAKEKNNFVYSPISVYLALSMCYAGASDFNYSEMHNLLISNAFSAKRNETLSPILAEMKNLIAAYLNCGPNTKLKIANAFFARPSYPFSQTYKNSIQTNFGAKIENTVSAATINKFVEDSTDKIIKELVTEQMITPETVAVLVNAIYFKGSWVHKFDKQKTIEKGEFRLFDGKVSTVPMMKKRFQELPDVFYGRHCWEDHSFKSLTLPYKDNTFSMVFILPSDSSEAAFNALYQTLFSKNQVLAAIKKEQSTNVEIERVQIPRFKLETSIKLNEPLARAGMQAAFGGGFNNMTDTSNNLKISFVVHKAFIEINEEGTEAAAATAVGMTDSLPKEFILDRPFICLLKHEVTGTLAFAAQVTKL